VSRSVEKCRGSVEAVSRWCRLALVPMVLRCVDPCQPVSEGGLTVYTRGACHSVDSVECTAILLTLVHDVINGHYLLSGTPQSS
jgi:hypothetical protein